jgi:hypothetical protein
MSALNWETYEKELTEIVEKYKHKATKKTIGRPNGNGLSNVYGGNIEIRKNHIIRGGHYGFDRFCPYVITVGSNVDTATDKLIAEEFSKIKDKYLEIGNLTINHNKVFDCSTFGTAYSTYGLGN